MAHVTLSASLIEKLAALPETGMGYQIVDLILSDGRVIHNVPVFNAEIADVPDAAAKVGTSNIVDARLSSIRRGRLT